MRVQFGYVLCPWSLKEDSLGRQRAKINDVRHTLRRTSHGGCCIDIYDSFECARCGTHLSLIHEWTPDDKLVSYTKVYWSPDGNDGP